MHYRKLESRRSATSERHLPVVYRRTDQEAQQRREGWCVPALVNVPPVWEGMMSVPARASRRHYE
jgi:hypothetical protein